MADARRQLRDDLASWLDPEVPRSWTPPARMLDAMIVGEPQLKPIQTRLREVFEATLTVDASSQRRTALIEVYNRQLVERRLATLGGNSGIRLDLPGRRFRLHSRRRGDQGLLHQSAEDAGRRWRRRLRRDHLPHGGLTDRHERGVSIHGDAGCLFHRAGLGVSRSSACSSAWVRLLSPERLRLIRRSLWPLRLTLWQMMCVVAVAAFLILVFEKGSEVALAFFAVSCLVLAWFVRAWSHEFVFLMGLRDDDFPGRHDKLDLGISALCFRADCRLVLPVLSPGSLARARRRTRLLVAPGTRGTDGRPASRILRVGISARRFERRVMTRG